MKVAIRTDASVIIGTGHVMRCLVLAEELRLKGAEVLFICRHLPGNLINFIRSKEYKVIELEQIDANQQKNLDDGHKLDSDEPEFSLEYDAEQTYRILEKQALWSWLIIDHYSIDERWEIRQKDVVDKILVIDDLADRRHSCNILLDQNYYADMTERYGKLLPEDCRKLLGPEFSLLRKEFREQREKQGKNSNRIKKVLIFFGGADSDNWTARVVNAIIENMPEKIIVDVVTGITNPHRNKLKALCAGAKSIKLHVQVEDMAQMMDDADLSIGGGGTVTWERCCLGLPTIAWPVADNQKKLLKDSASAGLVCMPDQSSPDAEEIVIHLRALLKNTALCESMKTRGRRLIDGRGSIRVANIMCPPSVSVFVAGENEMEKIFLWRNDFLVRSFSLNNDKIEFEQHRKWYKQLLEDPDRHILIGVVSNKEIGVLRLDVSGGEAEISIYLVNGMFMKGYGRALISAGEAWLIKNCPQVNSILAVILPENKVSIKLFEACGYQPDTMNYRKSLSNV